MVDHHAEASVPWHQRLTGGDDDAEQDAADADEIYRLLEEEIVPRYYDRREGLPKAWLQTMRASIGSALWPFSTSRMLSEYVDRLYLPVVELPIEAAASARQGR